MIKDLLENPDGPVNEIFMVKQADEGDLEQRLALSVLDFAGCFGHPGSQDVVD